MRCCHAQLDPPAHTHSACAYTSKSSPVIPNTHVEQSRLSQVEEQKKDTTYSEELDQLVGRQNASFMTWVHGVIADKNIGSAFSNASRLSMFSCHVAQEFLATDLTALVLS